MVVVGLVSEKEALVLDALLRADAPVSGRALSRITGLSQSSAQRAVARLRQTGLVETLSVPPALLYRPNLDHLAMPLVREMLNLDRVLRDRLADLVSTWKVKAENVTVYGSVARGEPTDVSDIDVLVIRRFGVRVDDPVWQEQIASMGSMLQRWTGRRASVIEVSSIDARHGLSSGEKYLCEAARDGWTVSGRPLAVLGGRKR